MDINSPKPFTNHLNASSYPCVSTNVDVFNDDRLNRSVTEFPPEEVNSTCTNFTASVATVYDCDFIFDVFVTSFLCFVGFIGNSVTIAVLQRDRDPHRQKSTNWLLQVLAIADTIYLAFAFIFLPIKAIALSSEAFPTVRYLFPYITTCFRPPALIAHMMTVWIVVLVTVDRYLTICKPLHPEWRSMRRVKMTVVVLSILAVVFHIPYFFEMGIIFEESCKDGELIPSSKRRPFVENIHYQYVYVVGCDCIFRSFGPLVVVVLFNVRLSWTIKDLNMRQRAMTLQVREEKTLTLILIIVVAIFVFCQLPFAALSFAFPSAVLFPKRLNTEAFDCALGIANALTVLNSSINFLVYCLIWRKFGRILVRMITCWKNKGSGQWQRTENSIT